MHRRDLTLATLCLPASAWAREQPTARLAAAWDTPNGAQVGVIQGDAGGWRVTAGIDVPTRPHGVLMEPEGTLLAVARRPGDWLLRWHRSGRGVAWWWNDAARRFNGHARRRGGLLFTTETELESGAGVIVVRDARSLAEQAVWPTHGSDPHDLRFAADGSVWVANGGITAWPETGRVKRDLARMDSSLVRLDGRDGRLLGQWRVDDSRLSLRHLALRGETVGIAMQAEHDDAARRDAAPLLAIHDGRGLRAHAAARPLAGYGGDIVANDRGFIVSATRADALACFDADGAWRRDVALAGACALASHGGRSFAGGRQAIVTLRGDRADAVAMPLRLDNHWIVLG